MTVFENLETFSTDLKKVASFINTNKSSLIDTWEKKARETVSPAKKSPSSILRNHLEELLGDLYEALSSVTNNKENARKTAEKNFTLKLSKLHGKNRNAHGVYQVHNVLEEYVLLRHVVTDAIIKQKLACLNSIEIINRLFEKSSLEAIREFQKTVDKNQQ